MTTTPDGTTTETTLTGEGTDESPDQTASPEVDPIALARKRQAGAEAARQEAARQLKVAQTRLAEFEAKDRDVDQQKAADIATLQERLAAAEAKAEQAEAKAEARILDVKYPNARQKLPEIMDEVRLAEFEAMFAEPDVTPSAPQNPNESNRIASGDATDRKPVEETSDDILARLKTLQHDWS
jgi:hypothetical protein